jgi:hypothetical protein
MKWLTVKNLRCAPGPLPLKIQKKFRHAMVSTLGKRNKGRHNLGHFQMDKKQFV